MADKHFHLHYREGECEKFRLNFSQYDYLERQASLPETTVTSVNGKTGDVELTASDVHALPDDVVIPVKTSDLLNDSGFVTDSYHDASKQDVISDLDDIRSGSALGATALQEHQDISGKLDKINVNRYAVYAHNGSEQKDLELAVSGISSSVPDNNKLPTVGGLVGYAAEKEHNHDGRYLTEHQDISGKQDILTPGPGISIVDNVISATGGGGGDAVWGDITGDISAQTDLKTALDFAVELFPCIYGTTTFAQITAALAAGKTPYCLYNDILYWYTGLSNGYYCFSAFVNPNLRRLYIKTSWNNGSKSINDFATAANDVPAYSAQHMAVNTVGTASLKEIYAGTEDMVAGSTPLATGTVYFVYEA